MSERGCSSAWGDDFLDTKDKGKKGKRILSFKKEDVR